MERRIEERLVYGIVRAEHELRVVLDNALRELGVTLTQWTVLSFLLREPGLSAADLARASGAASARPVLRVRGVSGYRQPLAEK